jgi:hypothetical protein
MNRTFFSFSLARCFNKLCSLFLMSLMSLLVACGGTSEVAQLPGPAQTPTVAAYEPTDFGNPKMLVATGAQTMTAQLSNCATTTFIVNVPPGTPTSANLSSATLQISAAGDMVFSAVPSTATSSIAIVQINRGARTQGLTLSRGFSGTTTAIVSTYLEDGSSNLGNNKRLSFSVPDAASANTGTFVAIAGTVQAIAGTVQYRCDVVGMSNFAPFQPKITGQRLAQTYLSTVNAVTSTGVQTATLSNGTVFWDNWAQGAINNPQQQNDQIRYVDLNFTSGVLSLSPSGNVPRTTSTVVPLFSAGSVGTANYIESYSSSSGNDATYLYITSSPIVGLPGVGGLEIEVRKPVNDKNILAPAARYNYNP